MIKIEQEKETEQKNVEIMAKKAFNNLYQPGCNEHLIVHNLRKSKAAIQELNLVLKNDNQIIGHIMYSKARIENTNLNVLILGPFCIDKNHQNKGHGTTLLKESLKKTKELGYDAVFLYGFPSMYLKHGFEYAAIYNISAPDGTYPASLLVYELNKGSLQNGEGKFFEEFLFETQPSELELFDQNFIELKKENLECQNDFLKMLDTFVDPSLVGSKI